MQAGIKKITLFDGDMGYEPEQVIDEEDLQTSYYESSSSTVSEESKEEAKVTDSPRTILNNMRNTNYNPGFNRFLQGIIR